MPVRSSLQPAALPGNAGFPVVQGSSRLASPEGGAAVLALNHQVSPGAGVFALVGFGTSLDGAQNLPAAAVTSPWVSWPAEERLSGGVGQPAQLSTSASVAAKDAAFVALLAQWPGSDGLELHAATIEVPACEDEGAPVDGGDGD
jgi:hypothetical protein